MSPKPVVGDLKARQLERLLSTCSLSGVEVRVVCPWDEVQLSS